MSKWATVVVAAVLALGVVVGCGEDDETAGASANGDTAPDVSPEKAKFVRQTDEICAFGRRQMMEALLAVARESAVPMSLAESIEVASREAWFAQVAQTIRGIRELGAPEGEEEELENVLGALEDAVEAAERTRIRSSVQFSRHFGDYNRLAYAYGFRNCLFRETHESRPWRKARRAEEAQ